ncbi:MAG: GEVED domain-containing protein, partial [Fuerstiella sp.]|nr:GEVED domain-containing protein [Fuerstiella sp.]
APDGPASTGEVEDYEVKIETPPPQDDLDFGDAPDGYPVTLADNGARHVFAAGPTGGPGLRLGTEWDSERDGTHSVNSDFDDLNPGASPDDEDGVTFGVLNPGNPAAVTDVTVNGAPPNGAFLDAWMDFNQNNAWEPSEQIFTSQVVVNGVNNLTFAIPAGALPGITYTRYRLSAGGGLAPDGPASTGEVEDYEVKIETPPPQDDLDFGDAPDGYPVTLADNGARHVFAAGPTGGPGLRLGTEWDSERDGTHSVNSDFDDLNPGASPDDEDGVTFGVLNPGNPAAVTDVTVNGAPPNGAFLDAWMDFNQNNAWEPSEQIFTSQVVVNGVNNLTFAIPAGALPGITYTRYRLSAGGGLAPDGPASTGEVEDYEVKIETPPPQDDLDFGDAPDGYPVTLADNGARHVFAAGPTGGPGLRLGTEWDSESDGTHSVNSDFDDLNPGASPDDEDGVTFGVLNPGNPAAVTDVTVNGAPPNGAFLDAWMDFNQNNAWEPSEQIFTSQVVVNGVNNLTFAIPAGALPGITYTRYR